MLHPILPWVIFGVPPPKKSCDVFGIVWASKVEFDQTCISKTLKMHDRPDSQVHLAVKAYQLAFKGPWNIHIWDLGEAKLFMNKTTMLRWLPSVLNPASWRHHWSQGIHPAHAGKHKIYLDTTSTIYIYILNQTHMWYPTSRGTVSAQSMVNWDCLYPAKRSTEPEFRRHLWQRWHMILACCSTQDSKGRDGIWGYWTPFLSTKSLIANRQEANVKNFRCSVTLPAHSKAFLATTAFRVVAGATEPVSLSRFPLSTRTQVSNKLSAIKQALAKSDTLRGLATAIP